MRRIRAFWLDSLTSTARTNLTIRGLHVDSGHTVTMAVGLRIRRFLRLKGSVGLNDATLTLHPLTLGSGFSLRLPGVSGDGSECVSLISRVKPARPGCRIPFYFFRKSWE